jgi:dTDP-glucose 4,6-dehydratase
MTRAIITGSAGFVGHHLLQYLLEKTDWDLIVIDKLSYAARGLDRLREIGALDHPRILVLAVDFACGFSEGIYREVADTEYIFHLGAESHVDNSVIDPREFVMSNVLGTMNVLELARELENLKQFVYFSTDEVFGPARDDQCFKDEDRYNSRNPYSATKAGGEELAIAYAGTYNLPVLVTHCNNVFGIRQHPEKFIPLVIKKLLNGERIEIHTNPDKTRIGSRYYVHTFDVCDALMFLIEEREWTRHKFNIPGQVEISNLDMAQKIALIIDRPLDYDFVGFRLGEVEHDLRYSTDGTKLSGMGWKHKADFDSSLRKVVEWTVKNPAWLE